MKASRGLIALATVGACVLATSVDTASSRPSATSLPKGGPTAAAVKEAKQLVAAAKAKPTFKAPGAQVNGSVLKNKSIWVITNVNVAMNTPIIQGIKQASKLFGAKVTVFDAAGKVSEMNRGMSQAISAHADAIVESGIAPNLTSAPLAQAKAKHIPVVDAFGTSVDTPKLPGNFAHVSILFSQGGKLQVDYLLSDSNGSAVDAVIFNDTEFPSEAERARGMVAEFKRLCPACKYQEQNVELANVATQLKSLTETTLRRDPAINYILADYDYQAQFIIPGVIEAGALGKVRVISPDASAPNLNLLRQKQQLVDIGEPLTWSGWAIVDEVIRALNNKAPVNENIPQRIFDTTNLPAKNNEATMFGTSYINGYRHLWGLK